MFHELRFDIYIYILPMFSAVGKKLHFSRQTVKFASLSLHHFAYRANQDPKLRSETTPELVSKP